MEHVSPHSDITELSPDDRYRRAAAEFGPAISRLAVGYEANPAAREDLVQDIHVRLWRSLKLYDGRCSLRSWVYRVAHNVAADHVAKEKRWRGMADLDGLDEAAVPGAGGNPEAEAAERLTLEALLALVRRLKPLDRQVMLLYLEDETAATIAEVTGLTAGAVATRIHRIKTLLADDLTKGART